MHDDRVGKPRLVALERRDNGVTGGKMNSQLKIGDKVVMNDNYYVSEADKGKIFTVRSEPWMLCGTEVIKISDKAGGYAVDGLTKVGDAEA